MNYQHVLLNHVETSLIVFDTSWMISCVFLLIQGLLKRFKISVTLLMVIEFNTFKEFQEKHGHKDLHLEQRASLWLSYDLLPGKG